MAFKEIETNKFNEIASTSTVDLNRLLHGEATADELLATHPRKELSPEVVQEMLARTPATRRIPRSLRPTEGSYINKQGYAFVVVDNKFVPEHRAVMERKLGRKLVKGESVHHKNGKRADNSEDNLELWLGPIRAGQRASDIKCPHCNKPWFEES